MYNGSLILVSKNSIESSVKKDIDERISNALNIEAFATYNYEDFPDYDITHWCYDKNKINLNNIVIEDQRMINVIKNERLLKEYKGNLLS